MNSEGVSDTIQPFPSSGETSIRTTISASGPGNIRVSGEGTYLESRNSSRGVSEQHFSCGKERWGKPPGDKSEKTQSIHALLALQKQNYFLWKTDLKGACFAIPLGKQLSKYVRFK